MPIPAHVPSTGFLIWHLSLRWRAELDRALAPLGLTSSQYAVLATLTGMLAAGESPNQRQLADASGLDTMHVSKLVRGLERSGLIERTVDPADPRAVRLAVTSRGAEAISTGRRAVLDLERRRLAVLGGPDDPRVTALYDALLTLLHQEPGA